MAELGQGQGVERVEERFLVLLKIPVVGQREALQGGQEPGQVADEPAGLAPDELGDVGVLLLRQHRAAGGVGVGQAQEAELLGGPQHDLLPQPGEVDLAQGARRTAARRRSRGRTRRRGSSRTGGRTRGRRPRRPGRGAASNRPGRRRRAARRRPGRGRRARRSTSRDRAQKWASRWWASMHGLGPLHVGVAGEVDVLGVGLGGPPEEHLHQVEEAQRGRAAALPPDVEPEVEGHLVVAAATGVELGPGRPGELRHPALDGGVDVLVEREEGERARGELGLHPRQGGGDHRSLLLGEEPDPGEHVDVGPGAGQVVGGETGVEREALGEVEQLRGRSVAEPSLPQGRALRWRRRLLRRLALAARPAGHWPAPCRRAHVSTDRPHRRTKPSASRWRKVSEAS